MSSPLKDVLESIIFISQEPLTVDRMAAVLEGTPG